MIIINKPTIIRIDNRVRFQSRIVDEAQHIDTDIWYETANSNVQYFDDSNADGFLVLMLLSSVKNQQEIVVKASVSEKLLYGIVNYVYPVLCAAYDKERCCKITPDEINKRDYKPKAIATGCSLGVDSFSSILHHLGPDCLENYLLTHLTYFNVGAMGSNYDEGTESSFFKDLKMICEFAEIIHLPVVWVNSNVHQLFKGFSFNASHTLRNMSVVLSMPNLFEKYYYASGFCFSDYKIDRKDLGKFEDVILGHLCTETTSLYSDDAALTRFQKTDYIKSSELVQKHLYVCLREQIKNDDKDVSEVFNTTKTINCSRCEKCLRTLLALDILGVLSQFSGIFDINYYQHIKPYFIAKVISQTTKSEYYKDLMYNMKNRSFRIPFVSYLLSPFYNVYLGLSKLKVHKSILNTIRE